MRDRVRSALSKQVTMPRWAIAADFLYRVFLLAGAAVVIVLWWQAATRDEEADRNARIQSCSSVYAATSAAHDAEALRLDQHGDAIFARLIRQAAGDGPLDPDLLAEYETTTADAEKAAERAEEMAARRIGLGIYAAQSVIDGNKFACPPLPGRLMVEAIAPPTTQP